MLAEREAEVEGERTEVGAILAIENDDAVPTLLLLLGCGGGGAGGSVACGSGGGGQCGSGRQCDSSGRFMAEFTLSGCCRR